jgi:hypothetical protein
MSISRKPSAEITIDDLENLITAGARETGELEFKGRFRSSLRKDSRKLRIDGSRKATVLVTMREMKFLPN